MIRRLSYVAALMFVLVIVPLWLTAQANPVPYPVIGMPYEYIYANITVTDGNTSAKVNGTYPFVNIGYQNISMSYPLPDDATDVAVRVDGNAVFWSYTNQTYETVFGALPVMNWTITPAPDTFTVEVDYEHSVPMGGQGFAYFYAMGTWKEVYAKQMTAYVTADITIESIGENETLEVYAYEVLLNSTIQEWVWNPLECAMSRINNTFRVNATVQSDMFAPIKGDFVLTFKTEQTIPQFPSVFILPLFMIATLLVVIVFRKRAHYLSDLR